VYSGARKEQETNNDELRTQEASYAERNKQPTVKGALLTPGSGGMVTFQTQNMHTLFQLYNYMNNV
jgi:hypothetical protein